MSSVDTDPRLIRIALVSLIIGAALALGLLVAWPLVLPSALVAGGIAMNRRRRGDTFESAARTGLVAFTAVGLTLAAVFLFVMSPSEKGITVDKSPNVQEAPR